MKTRVLSIDLAASQGGILHFGRKRVRNGIAKDTQANRWINVACYLTPLFKVAERITLRGLNVFHVIPNVVSDPIETQNVLSFSCDLVLVGGPPLRFAQDDTQWTDYRNATTFVVKVVDCLLRR